jgi:hypothetical protein
VKWHLGGNLLRRAAALAVLALLVVAGPARTEDDPEWCHGPEGNQFSIEVADSAFTLFHDGAAYNCCPGPIEFHVSCQEDLITILEYEHDIEGGCACMCCYNLSVRVDGLAPGPYEVRAIWGHGPLHMWTTDILIPDVDQSGLLKLGNTFMSPCLKSNPDTAVEASTWSRLKALFR